MTCLGQDGLLLWLQTMLASVERQAGPGWLLCITEGFGIEVFFWSLRWFLWLVRCLLLPLRCILLLLSL